MTIFTRGAAACLALAISASAASAQQLVFSGVSPTSDDYQLGVV